MTQRVWTIDLDGGSHAVEFDHRFFSGKRTIRVDRQIATEARPALSMLGDDLPFQIGAHSGVVHTRSNLLSVSYDLSIDGRSVETGQPIAPIVPMPKWAWLFVLACIAIPVVALGGALPAIIGFVGAYACVAVVRKVEWKPIGRVAAAIGVVAAAWGVFLVLSGTVLSTRTLLTPQPAWTEFTSTEGRFSVWMPGAPNQQTQPVTTDSGSIDLIVFTAEDRSGGYAVMYSDFPGGVSPANANAVLETTMQGGVSNMQGTLLRQSNITLRGYAGREIQVDVPAQNSQPASLLTARYYLVDNRLYQLLVITHKDQPTSDALRKFFDSFNLIK